MSDEGSDDSAPRPKRKIKRVVVMSSSSGSDSDENIVAGTRRKRLRVVSEAEGDSSGSSVICAGSRRKRTLPKLRDSEAESDTSGWATDQSDAAKPAPAAKSASGFASDSSEGNSDKCSICLMRFTNQEVGTPQNCEHIFCLDCITEWSKNVNTCPVDRITFESIVVKACAGGRVLRTEPVKVVQRRPSVEMLVVEDPTVCEICGSAENEESMLLCDGCDLGFHMQCLSPPLTEVPVDQWFCPNCAIMEMIHLSEVDDLFSSLVDMEFPLGPRRVPLRQVRETRRSNRNRLDEPSTSSGRRGGALDAEPSTSQGRQTSRSDKVPTTRRRTTTAPRRKYKRRRTKTVLIEYEVQENGKFPITKTVKRRVKKRRVKKRQPRTAARMSHVRASVRAKLATMKSDQRVERSQGVAVAGGRSEAQELSWRRRRAGIPALSLFGDAHQLDYFSEDEANAAEGGTVAVAARPTSGALSTLRQARRKMIGIPSPPHAASAPDVLSSILESQTLLHSKNSIVEISVDGNVNIKLQKKDRPLKKAEAERVDLSKGEDASKKAPSYPGQSRGGGWGGGYRGNYHREHGTGGFHRASYGDPGAPPRPSYPSNGARREDDNYGGYMRRSYPPDEPFDRRVNRRPEPGRGAGAWPPPGPARPRPFDDPLDMRVGTPADRLPPADKPFRPLPEPPVFNFDKTPEVDRSEDERSDSGLVIDTEKYDPMEPTNDDDEEPAAPAPAPAPAPALPAPPAPPPLPEMSPPIADITNVHPDVLDSAVRQVLREHQNLLAPAAAHSDNDSDGDCPNFSIYSATSVHIASEGGSLPPALPPLPAPGDDLTDLVQEDDEPDPVFSTPTKLPEKNKLDYNEKVSKRCPITTNPRTPIKIKLNTPSLIKRQVSLYDDEEEAADESEPVDKSEASADDAPDAKQLTKDDAEVKDNDKSLEETMEEVNHETEMEKRSETEVENEEKTPPTDSEKETGGVTPDRSDDGRRDRDDDKSPETALAASPSRDDKPDDTPPRRPHDDDDDDDNTDNDNDSDDELAEGESPQKALEDKAEDALDKLTESISETEDERSYTPCLDENKSKDTSLETDKGIEGLDTEMISEDEGNEMFSDEGRASPAPSPAPSPARSPALSPALSPAPTPCEDGEILDKRDRDDTKKKKKKDSKRETKKEAKEKNKSKTKKTDVAFKKLSKSGKERNYRDKDKERRDSSDAAEKKRKRKEKRKDLERYDVRTVVTEKRRKVKDPFGRDVSPPPSPSPPPRASASPGARLSLSPRRRSVTPVRRSPSPRRRSSSIRRRSPSIRRQSPSVRRRSPSIRRGSPPIRRRSPSIRRGSPPIRRGSPLIRRGSPPIRRGSPLIRRGSPPIRRGSPPIRRGSPPLRRRSPSLRRRSPSPRRHSPVIRHRSPSPRRRSNSPVPPRRRSTSTPRARLSLSPRSPSPRRRRRSLERRRRRSTARKRRRSAERSPSPRAKGKRKRRARSERPVERKEARRKSPKRRRARRRSAVASPAPLVVGPALGPGPGGWSPASVDSRLLSPRTPPPEPAREERTPKKRRRDDRPRHKRTRDHQGPSKEVFTSGDNILVSVSFKDDERVGGAGAAEARRLRRLSRRRRRAQPDAAADARPVAIIDLERSPFRELTPEPTNVIVLSDTEQGPTEAVAATAIAASPAAAREGPAAPASAGAGPRTPPARSPAPPAPAPPSPPSPADDASRGPNTPPEPPLSPDAYDPFEPTRSPSPAHSPPSPAPAPPSPPRPSITLETAQKTNLSADDVIDRRPLSPMEKVMALLQSTRDVSPEPPPCVPPAGGSPGPPGAPPAPPAPPTAAAAPRIVLPEAVRAQPPKLFLAKPSPIKSDPIKPLQVFDALLRAESPYSPGSSDFGELFSPPGGGGGGGGGGAAGRGARHERRRARHHQPAKVPVKFNKKKGKTQVGVKIDDDNLKILDELPSSAVEMQVKNKFLKKLNRQERVVEEVKLVLKPHYNKKRVTKDEYKDILRRAVPKICHNKTGEINPTKIQALVEAYVKKFRKRHKLGLA